MTPTHRWTEAVIANRKEMAPNPTDVIARLNKLPDIRAVVFDVYGTLVISGSGDVGSADTTDNDSQVSDLRRQIEIMNDERRSEACPKPEVDIVEAWRRTLQNENPRPTTEQLCRIAAEHESRANPTWPMPGAKEVLDRLSHSDLLMGIVSNAQIFTIPLVIDLVSQDLWNGQGLSGRGLADGGFDLDLCIFSNRFRQAKPGPRLFDVLRQGLVRRGIEPHQTIYVGNDMLNDVWAASMAGLKTAWFVGDSRSCRRRENDPRCQSLEPDLILSNLMQLPSCLGLQ